MTKSINDLLKEYEESDMGRKRLEAYKRLCSFLHDNCREHWLEILKMVTEYEKAGKKYD